MAFSVTRLLRKVPVAEQLKEIGTFINRELLPYLHELRESLSNAFVGFGSDTIIIADDGTAERAALTGDVTSVQNSNVTAFRTFSAKSILANATNADAIPTELAATRAYQVPRVNTANTATVMQVIGGVSANGSNPDATNAATNLSVGGEYTVQSEEWEDGTCFEFFGTYVFVEPAAPPTLTVEILIAGVVQETMIITSTAAAGTRGGQIGGYIRNLTLGSSGTCMLTITRLNNHGSTEDQRSQPTLSVAPVTVNTTIANTIQMRIRMTTAVVDATLTVTQGFVRKAF
mgnify:CR=1 FL=1